MAGVTTFTPWIVSPKNGPKSCLSPVSKWVALAAMAALMIGSSLGRIESKRLSSPCWRQRRWRRSEVGRRQSVPVGKPSVERWPEGS